MMIKYHPAVRKALDEKQAVVALESTIISHGMPYPENVAMARRVEAIIKEEGAVPATIAILDGVLHIGLTDEQLTALATANDVIKTSKRDFGAVISQKRHGATTVSGTMIAAALANIKVFATGGIGGVHRGAETSFDISRDLEELADLSVLVVCAGVKSILDIPLTLEYLETKGVEVLGYQTKELPAFYTRNSGYVVDYACEDALHVAKVMQAKWDLGVKGGLVLANPIPVEASIEPALINKAIDEALKEMEIAGIKGKESTPYLLAKVKELTSGKSLDANLALVYNNARVAARVAMAYQTISK